MPNLLLNPHNMHVLQLIAGRRAIKLHLHLSRWVLQKH